MGLGIGIGLSLVMGEHVGFYDWYVDGDISSSGNGKSLATAFKTIAEAQAAMSASQSVWIEPLDDASPYREMLDLTGLDGSKIYSSGVVTNGSITTQGAKIDCRDVLVNASFSKTAGQTNVYQIDVTFETTGLTDPQIKIWEDGTVLSLVADLATCDSTPGSMYVAAHNSSPQTVYVHASDSSDVTANGKQYEHNKRHSAIMGAGVDNLTISGVHCYANLHGNGSLRVGDNAKIVNTVCEEGSKHNLLYGEGCKLTDVLAYNAYWYSTGGTMYVYNKGIPTSQGIMHTRCYATSDDGNGANLVGFHGHKNTSGSFGVVTYTSCVSNGCYSGWYCADGTSIQMIGCTVTNATRGVEIPDTSPRVLTNCTITIGAGGRCVIALAANEVITISGGTFTHTTGAGYIINLQGFASPTLTIDGLTFDGVAGNTYGINHTGTGGTINVQNCEITELFEYVHTNSGSAALTSDYNHFDVGTMDAYVQGVKYNDIASYQSGTSQDANSTVG